MASPGHAHHTTSREAGADALARDLICGMTVNKAGAVAGLRQKGPEIIMLTGGNERTAQAIGRELCIDRIIAAAAMALGSLSVIANSALRKRMKL